MIRGLFRQFPGEVPLAKAMDPLKDRAVLPANQRLYVVQSNLAVFGESTIGGEVTGNCAASLRSFGLEVPAGLAESGVVAVKGVIGAGSPSPAQ